MNHKVVLEIETDTESVFDSVRASANEMGRIHNTSVYFEITSKLPDVQETKPELDLVQS